MPKIVVIGSFVLDMVASVDEFPREGQTILGKRLKTYPGGKGANQCVTVARLGGNVEMAGMLGNDVNGRIFLDLLDAEGIGRKHVYTTDKEPTAVAQIQINRHAENKIVVLPSANYEFTVEDLRRTEDEVKGCGLVMAQLELRHEVTAAIVKMCKRLQVPLLLNPAPAYELESEILSAIDYLTPNETELQILSGLPVDTIENVKKAAEHLLSVGVKNIVATLGSRGALIANKDGIRQIEGYKVKVLDTVAAGDSFNGALAKCITDGMKLDDAVRFANAVGALTVTRAGAIPSLPRLDEVLTFIKSHS